MPINNTMDKEKNNNKDQEKPQGIDRVDLAVFDHILIVDNQTGEKIVNKRG